VRIETLTRVWNSWFPPLTKTRGTGPGGANSESSRREEIGSGCIGPPIRLRPPKAPPAITFPT